MGPTGGERKRVVLVCMVDSIHSARWIEQFRDQDVDFILFPSTPNRRVHPRIRALLAREHGRSPTVSIAPFGGALSIPLWGADLVFDDRVRGLLLRSLIRRVRPDFVHALELNHGGYVASQAYAGLTDAPPLIATNWGSDIYWFQRFPRHEKRIRKLLAQAQFYSAECNRDIDLAITHGFTGESFEVFPNAGGFPADLLAHSQTQPSSRRVVLVKGYESFVGRASIALKAVELAREQLAGYRIVVYSANSKTQRLARATRARTGLDITCHPKKALSHEAMMELFAQARVYLGISLSDGISTSLLEAMAAGCFPIQTNTSCASEWIQDGSGGFVVDAGDLPGIASALTTALTGDDLVNEAARANSLVARERLDEIRIRAKSFRFYGLASSSDMSAA